MDLENLINAFIPYGLPSLVIGAATGLFFGILERILLKREKTLGAYLPIGAAVAIFMLYTLIISPSEVLFEQTISAGLLSGSLSAAVFAFIKNLKSGNADGAALKNLLSCYLDDKKAAALCKKIKDLIKSGDTNLHEDILTLLEKEDLTIPAAKELVKKICEGFFNATDKDKK